MASKQVRSETIFGTTSIQAEKSNCHKRLSGSQRDPKEVHILYNEKPLNGFGFKRKGLRSKHKFKPKCNFLIFPD